MYVSGGEGCPIELRRRIDRGPVFDATFDPDFIDASLLPVGEQADAVASGYNLLEMIHELSSGQVQVHVLTHQEGGFDIQRDLRHYAKRAEINDGRLKPAAVLFARELQHLAIRGHDFQGGNRRSEVCILYARPVGCRGAGAGDRNMRQRGEVVQRKAMLMEKRTQLT